LKTKINVAETGSCHKDSESRCRGEKLSHFHITRASIGLIEEGIPKHWVPVKVKTMEALPLFT